MRKSGRTGDRTSSSAWQLTLARRRRPHPPRPRSGTPLEFKPQLLLEDTAKIARLMQAARTQSGGATPRLLEGPGMAAGLSPRGALQLQPRMALTIGGAGSGSSSSRSGGSPSFVLSWLGSTSSPASSGSTGSSGGEGSGRGNGAPAPGSAGLLAAAPHAGPPSVQDAVKGAAKRKDAAPAAAPAPPGRPSPSKAAKAVVHVQEQDGHLVFSPAHKVRFPRAQEGGDALARDGSVRRRQAGACPQQFNFPPTMCTPLACDTQAKGGRSRMGLSLSDATGMLKLGGGGGGGSGEPAQPLGAFAPLPGSIVGGGSDTSSSKDLVLSKRA